MPWYPERPTSPTLILPPPGWHPEPAPEEVHVERPPGWWAIIALDTAVTIHWVSALELEFIKGVGFEVLALTASRQLALQKIGMLALERNIEAQTPMELHGVYMLGLALSVTLQHTMAFTKLGLMSFDKALNLTPNLMLGNIKTLDVSRAVLATPSLMLTPIRMMSLPQVLSATPSLQLGAFLSIAFSQSIAASSPLAFGFPPTAEVTDAYSTTNATSALAYTHTIRRWCDFTDVVLLGSGGGGQGSGSSFVDGFGAQPGQYATITLVRGPATASPNTIAWALLTITGTVGAPGAGGNAGLGAIPGIPGSAGAATTAVISGLGTLSASGGSGGALGAWGADKTGGGPGDLTFNGQFYDGGSNTANSGSAPGLFPGGGGAGAAGGFFSGSKGGNGARGKAWYRSYQ
ncbi:minor tail protein [Mycobacterium phage PenguinLover67]|nr:minor tail protein [Mycobacterium phage PenguinLover67]